MPQRADTACSEKAELFTDSGAGAGLHRGRIPVRGGIYRQHPAVLLAGRPDIKIERLHNGWQASKHSSNYSLTY